jgi:hypothetical protein
MQMKIRRSSPKRNRKKQALIAVGAIGIAAETARRMRHRKQNEEPEAVEH